MTSLTAFRRREQRKQFARFALRGLVIGFVLFIGFIFVSRAVTIHQMQAELAQRKQEKEKLEQERKTLQDLLAHKDDPTLIEWLARTQLGLVKKGEQKLKIKLAPPEAK